MSSKAKASPHQEILEGFNKLRQEQRNIAGKLAELEGDTAEHSIVIDALEKVEQTRQCYRLIGGVLVERTVAEVLPALRNNKSQIVGLVEVLNKQLVAKAKELNDFKEKHNIKIQGQPDIEESSKEAASKTLAKTSGVLIADS